MIGFWHSWHRSWSNFLRSQAPISPAEAISLYDRAGGRFQNSGLTAPEFRATCYLVDAGGQPEVALRAYYAQEGFGNGSPWGGAFALVGGIGLAGAMLEDPTLTLLRHWAELARRTPRTPVTAAAPSALAA